jgi:hypothetical protein
MYRCSSGCLPVVHTVQVLAFVRHRNYLNSSISMANVHREVASELLKNAAAAGVGD